MADFCVLCGWEAEDFGQTGSRFRFDRHPFSPRQASVSVSMGIRLEMDAYAIPASLSWEYREVSHNSFIFVY
ncbi:hypothetical protein [uncultured Parabacteroides sp.]|uniref:hypothetical protein n=1 Tax=uncultured Parabacteroides sp. TaxID=512312 RepID=UPI0028044E2E|nr:hypothetical protein [uncultured Parabacteroides sp.]